jgi:molybdopterin-biosynthesis enzyme MoeA-like protein
MANEDQMSGSSKRIWTAGLAVIGDEILSGRTQDKNIAQVPDIEDRIIEAVNALRDAYDYCFTTGGIGPTHDDITVDAVARALGVPVIVHPDARAILERYYADKGGVNESRLRMARVPEGAELIPNRMSGAPGIRLGNLFLMAGVPHITAGMLDTLSGQLEGGRPLVSVTVGAFAPESEIAEMLREAEQSAEGISIGSYPFFKDGRVGSNFVVRSEDKARAQSVAEQLAAQLADAGYHPVAGGI